MKTYTVLIESKGQRRTERIRAASNRKALIVAANKTTAAPYDRVRVFQGGWGYDSGWLVKQSKYL